VIKKTAALAVLLSVVSLPVRAEEIDPGDFGAKKRLALNTIGIGGAITAVGGVFFFVGRSGAGLHVNGDGTLKATGDLSEAYSAVQVQRVSAVIVAIGVAVTITGTLLLLLGRKRLSLAPGSLTGPLVEF